MSSRMIWTSTKSSGGKRLGAIMYICSPKWVYRSKKLAAQKIWVSYLQFQGGDFRPHTAIN